MAIVHDIRSQAPRTNGTRSLSQIKNIARHHSATTDGDFFAFWKTWNGVKGWGTGGYHEIILRDGSVQLCYDPEEITNGVANHNTPTYHICVVGNGSFTAAQEATFKERCLYNMKRLNVPAERVLGHNEFKGASTACPGISMDGVRKSLQSTVILASNQNRTYLIEGDSGDKVKELQKNLNIAGFSLSVDGIYGEATTKAVSAFQRGNGLEEDGVFGVASAGKLNAIIANLSKPPTVAKPKEEVEVEYEKNAQPSKSLAEEFKRSIENELTDGTYPHRPATREELAVVGNRVYEKLGKKIEELLKA